MTYFETFRKMVKMSKPFRTNFSLSKRLLLVTNAKFLLKMSEKNGLTKSNFSSFTFMSKTCILQSNFCLSTFSCQKISVYQFRLSLLFFIYFTNEYFLSFSGNCDFNAVSELRSLKSRLEELESDLKDRDEEISTLKDQKPTQNGDESDIVKVSI